MLRAVVLAFGLGLVACAAIAALIWPQAWPAALELGIVGGVVIAGITFERRYRFRRIASGDDWQHTGERFKDPTSGKLVEVRWNRKTGERAYIDVE